MNLLEDLNARGFLAQQTAPVEELDHFLSEKPRIIYAGFDPTADSLQAGNLVPVMGLRRFQQAGHKPIALVGGATGMIGDPSGKSDERNLLIPETLEHNLSCQKKQLEQLLDFGTDENKVMIVNNYDWMKEFSFLEFLRDVGKNFRIGEMMSKDSVKNRIGSEGSGMSYTEFSYQILQGYDFYHLYKNMDCEIQIGGSDQWGNIVSGTELIRRKLGVETQAFGITFPLVTTATGEKLGKSAGNAIWLDPEKTSPYEFYQYWINTDDRDVERYLLMFSFKPLNKIKAIVEEHQTAPERRMGQKALAEEITEMVHGQDQLQKALSASKVLFGGSIEGLSADDLKSIFSDVPSTSIDESDLNEGISILDLFAQVELSPSRGQAKKLVQSGGAYLNNEKITDIGLVVKKENLASESVLILRSGKKKYHLVQLN